jgi:hypothetical protein
VRAFKSAESPPPAPRPGFMVSAGESGSLFTGNPVFSRNAAARRRLAPELAAARVLCHQLRRKRVSADKKRIVHLICLNLLAVLKRRP